VPLTAELARTAPDDVTAVAIGACADRLEGDGVDWAFLAAQGFAGKRGEVRALPGGDGPTLYVVGLGKSSEVDVDALRETSGSLARAAKRHASIAVDLLGHLPEGASVAKGAQAIVEGIALGGYEYGTFKSDHTPSALRHVTVIGGGGQRVQAAIDRALTIGDAVGWVRDLVNEPGGSLTPSKLAQQAASVGEQAGFEVTVWDEKEIRKQKLGGLLGVNRGSAQHPRFLHLRYEPEQPKATIALVGKGITFDSGGLSLKPPDAMIGMKGDMGGAGAVLGAFRAIAALGAKVRVLGFLPITDNMTGGDATRVGDVLTIRNGKTVEVLNTDAEGRLILADALSLATEAAPDAIVDLATLTGACMIALGHGIAAMGNDEWLLDTVVGAASASRERVWPMPLWPEYRDKIKSDVADIKNSAGREAGALTAGAFLGAFTDAYRWVHLDIAGSAWNTTPTPVLAAGASGAGVRTLCQFLIDWKPPRGKCRDPRPGPRTSLRGVDPVDASGDPVNPLRSPGARKAAKRRAAAKPTTRKKAARRTKKSPRSGR